MEDWFGDPVIQRLASRTLPDWDKCWLWQGGTNPQGNGLARYQGKVQAIHRIAYQVVYGEIPEGTVIHRTCYNRLCWRPHHLEAITPRESQLRQRQRTLFLKAGVGEHPPMPERMTGPRWG